MSISILTKAAWMTALLSGILTANGTGLSVGGSPAALGTVGEEYRFLPTVDNANTPELEFNYINKPDWTRSYRGSGLIRGIPEEPGVYANIQIGVWDGVQYAVTAPFTITIRAPATGPVESGIATLTWTKPLRNSDGSPLTNLAGFLIRYGAPKTPWRELAVTDAGSTEARIEGLAAGTWYFQMAALNTAEQASTFTPSVDATLR